MRQRQGVQIIWMSAEQDIFVGQFDLLKRAEELHVDELDR